MLQGIIPPPLVRRKKPVIDTFQFYCLHAGDRHGLSYVCLRINQILANTISKAVIKFKGLAWLTYDKQFRQCAAYNHSKAWNKIDLELCTVTFSGLAKPRSVCSSLYHQAGDCPNQNPSRKPRCQALVCFDFKKPSGCQCHPCHFQHNCCRCGSAHTQFNCPGPKPPGSSNRPSKK